MTLAGPFHGKRVLIVEDEEEIREIICDFVASGGGSTLEAQSGKQALQVAMQAIQKGEKIDAVFTDYRMKDGDGLFLIKELKKALQACPPIVVITGHSDVQFEELLKQGASAVLAKPFNSSELKKIFLKLTKG